MSLVSRDPILLTPGPLTTSLATKTAMLRDWGSWDASFNAITADVRRMLLDIANAKETHVCVPMQGSGTFSIEAAVNTLLPRDGHMLVLINGAYGKRMAKLVQMMGRQVSVFETPEDVPTTAADVDRLLTADTSITHVGLIHCETSTGILNPLHDIAEVVARHKRSLIIDAMSSFGALPVNAKEVPFDALIAASGKCIEGPPGMGFVLARRTVLEKWKAIAPPCRLICSISGPTWRRPRNGALRRRPISSPRSIRRCCNLLPKADRRRGWRATRRTMKP